MTDKPVYQEVANVNFVDGNLTVDDGSVVFLEQPCWPDGTPWADETEARHWAQLLIAHMDDPNKPEPPTGP